jgi:hypothetical protein
MNGQNILSIRACFFPSLSHHYGREKSRPADGPNFHSTVFQEIGKRFTSIRKDSWQDAEMIWIIVLSALALYGISIMCVLIIGSKANDREEALFINRFVKVKVLSMQNH